MFEPADLVIVGAGSAGAIIAARASENGARSVLLLEAGPDYAPEALPRDLANGTRNSLISHDWGYRHRPRPRGLPFLMPRGRVVGGSSAVNTCIALRGQIEDYDEWASRGLSEWSFEQCLPAFKRLERDHDFDDEWHGTDGPFPIRRAKKAELVPWQQAFYEACLERGLGEAEDFNNPHQTGVASHPMNLIDGRRISVAEAYLTDAVRRRDNLRIQPETTVRRVLFEKKRAVGLEVEHAGRVEVVRGDRIVLSAGVIGSPGILIRSGVGPRRDVERLGVQLVADNENVGARLLDHPGTAIFFRPKRGVFQRGAPLIQVGIRFRWSRGTMPNDLQLQPGSVFAFPGVDLPAMAMMTHVGKPVGTGRIRFESVDPAAKPKIDSRLFEEEADVDAILEALELARDLSETRAVKAVATPLIPWSRTLRSRSKLRRWVRTVCDSGYHPCGTVPMGADDDPTAACDGRGRVRGVERLYVADASIMPTVPTSNINLPTLMIGERFGEWFRGGD